MRRLIAACLGVLLTTTTVYADKPFQSRYLDEFSSLVSCVGFDLTLNWSTEVHETWFLGKDGFPKAGRLQFRGDVEIVRDGFPEKTLYGRRADNQTADVSDGFTGFVITGGFIKVNLPGYGHLYFDAGRVEFDGNFNVTRVRGANHDHLLEHTDALCGYFQ
jgi:hypothetical protein